MGALPMAGRVHELTMMSVTSAKAQASTPPQNTTGPLSLGPCQRHVVRVLPSLDGRDSPVAPEGTRTVRLGVIHACPALPTWMQRKGPLSWKCPREIFEEHVMSLAWMIGLTSEHR